MFFQSSSDMKIVKYFFTSLIDNWYSKMSGEKSAERTSIMVSIQTYDRLNKAKEDLEKIIGKPMPIGKAIMVLLTAKPLDLMLEDMILEEYPTVINEPSKREEELKNLEKQVVDFIESMFYPQQLPEKRLKELHDRFEQFLLVTKG